MHIPVMRKKKSRKGKRRNVSRLQREREMRKQIKGAQNSNFINRAAEREKARNPTISSRRRILSNLGVNPNQYDLLKHVSFLQGS